jgi:hypothetical protein
MRGGRIARRLACMTCALVLIASQAGPAFAIDFLCDNSPQPQVMVDVDGVFAYRDSNWASPKIGRMLKFQCHAALARDESSAWVLVPFGSTRAWVSRAAVRFADGMDITQLPFADQIPPAPPARALQLPGVPVVSKAIQQRYLDAVRAGRAPDMVTVLGDCNSEHPVYFGRLDGGGFDLTPYPDLRRVALAFTPSFRRVSLATSGSFNVTMALDPTWADPKQCERNEGPLDCELRLSNASLLIISLGTGDTFTWRDFERHYAAIIERALASQVVPLLMTKADELEARQGGAPADYINTIIRQLGARYSVPVIDLALAARQLPDGGLVIERNDKLQQIDPFHLSAAGADAKIWLTLRTLAQFPKATPNKAATAFPTHAPAGRRATVTPTPSVPKPTQTPRPTPTARERPWQTRER